MPELRALPPVRWLRRGLRWLTPASWRAALARLAVLAALAGVGALAFITAGLTPIAADDGHWRVTRAFLEYTMTRTVRRQAAGTVVPALDDPDLVLRGAGHYAGGCVPCHGAPGQARSQVVRHMVPEPPYLPEALGDWNAAESFWIVRHGLKYTAMPAWPSEVRDDEVWAMVAFLQRLPTMQPDEYRALAFGDAAGGGSDRLPHTGLATANASVLADCTRCHGRDGRGSGRGAAPRLAGQDRAYLLDALRAYADGTRHSGIMQPVAAALDAQDMARFADFYAALPATAGAVAPAPGAALRARGASLAREGSAPRRIPACSHCHGGDGDAVRGGYPVLAGQHAAYLGLQLRLFRDGNRGGGPFAGLMHAAAANLADDDIEALAAYYAAAPTVPAAIPGAAAEDLPAE
jgi:cytochrome c553